MSDAAIRFFVGIADFWLLLLVVIPGTIYAVATYRPKPKAPAPALPDDGMRKCRGCGATFHESWIDHQIGRFCPNCTGAD